MTPGSTYGLLVAGGGALVVQNLLMARISGATSSLLAALMLNSAVGLALLAVLILCKSGLGGIGDIAGHFRPWFLIPGLLGTFFVFASLTGYRNVGAAPTIAVLVASQLVFGLTWDMARADDVTFRDAATAAVGTGLLICGVFLVVSRGP